MVLSGLLGDRLGPVLLLNIQGSGYFLSGVLAILLLSRFLAKKVAKSGIANIEEKEIIA